MLGTVVALSAILSAAAAPELGNAGIVDAIDAASLTSQTTRDPFSRPAASALSGQAVTFSAPILMDGDADRSGPFHWSYDLDRRRLTIRMLPMNYNHGVAFMEADDFVIDVSAPVSGWEVKHTVTDLGSREMVNGYGARFDVERREEKVWAVAEVGQGYRSNLPGRQESFYTHELRIDPDAARSLAENLRFEARGVVRDHKPGQAVVCGSMYSGATIRNPRQMTGETCVLTVEWTSFAFIDGRDGAVVKAWADR